MGLLSNIPFCWEKDDPLGRPTGTTRWCENKKKEVVVIPDMNLLLLSDSKCVQNGIN
jgi:hypothetical protein